MSVSINTYRESTHTPIVLPPLEQWWFPFPHPPARLA
jgi:hypothetical protein